MLTTFIFTALLISTIFKIIMKIEKRRKFLPAKIKKTIEEEFHVQLINRQVRVRRDVEDNIFGDHPNTDYIGTKRFRSTCYFKPSACTARYSETLMIDIGSNNRVYDEKVWYKTKHQPYYWSESLSVDVNFPPEKKYSSEVVMGVENYVALVPQQLD